MCMKWYIEMYRFVLLAALGISTMIKISPKLTQGSRYYRRIKYTWVSIDLNMTLKSTL